MKTNTMLILANLILVIAIGFGYFYRPQQHPKAAPQQLSAHCYDSIENGDESDIDCGGGHCVACANERHCYHWSDCQSGICMNHLCVPNGSGAKGKTSSCSDGIQNGAETDVDCGGNCSPCMDEHYCVYHADCISSVCAYGICWAALCDDSDCCSESIDHLKCPRCQDSPHDL